jgi:hypothetical protein
MWVVMGPLIRGAPGKHTPKEIVTYVGSNGTVNSWSTRETHTQGNASGRKSQGQEPVQLDLTDRVGYCAHSRKDPDQGNELRQVIVHRPA